MATSANVDRTPKCTPLPISSRHADAKFTAINVISQVLDGMNAPFCFPPEPVISMLLGLLEVQKRYCVVLVPHITVWVNMLKLHSVDTLLVSKPFDNTAFTLSHPTGKRVPKLLYFRK